MDDAFQSWLEQAVSQPGILAGVVRVNAQTVLVKSRQPEYPEAKIKELIRGLAESVQALQQNRIATGYLRWNFENALVHCATGSNETLALLLTGKEMTDSATVGRLMLEFLQIAS